VGGQGRWPSLRSVSLATDLELLTRSRDGDQASFTELMKRHEQQVFAIAYRILGDRNDAADAVQDTFINVYRRSESFRGDSAFSTWLYRIAVNASKDVLRRKLRAPVPHEQDSSNEAVAPGPEVADTVALHSDLAKALAQLPEDYREAVVMFDIGGIPYEEIAATTGAALGTVKSRISRGRRRLAELLEQPTPPPPSKETT
jgi:RNA polymerase sigma-70 factor (ECF subfamily)